MSEEELKKLNDDFDKLSVKHGQLQENFDKAVASMAKMTFDLMSKDKYIENIESAFERRGRDLLKLQGVEYKEGTTQPKSAYTEEQSVGLQVWRNLTVKKEKPRVDKIDLCDAKIEINQLRKEMNHE